MTQHGSGDRSRLTLGAVHGGDDTAGQAEARINRSRVLAFGGAGSLMLLSVTLIAMARLGLPVSAGWIAAPAILAQLAALAGLTSLYRMARHSILFLAKVGLAATLVSVSIIVAAAAWLVLAAAEGPPGEIRILAAAFVAFQMVAFLANSGALTRSGPVGRSVALWLLLPPLLWGAMMVVALVRGLDAALELDLYTNAGAGVALLRVAALLRRDLAIQARH